ncbi:MAG: SPOR domain-containing protein [Pseudomonadota bacterium]
MARLSDGPDYDYGPYEDEYRGFDRAGDEGGRGPVILFLALGVLIIFAGVIWNTYRQGIRPAGAALPVVSAPEQPYKRVAEVPGGQTVPDTDKGYYGMMEGEAERAVVERAAIQNRPNLRRGGDTLAGGPESLPPVPAGTVTSEGVRVAEATVEGLDPRVSEAAESEPVRTAALNTGEPMRLTPPRETVPEPRLEVPDPVRAIESRFSTNGAFQIQLAALRSEAAARSAWAEVTGDHDVLFSGARLDIQRADLGARGVFYRLRVGTFESRDVAKAFCADYKAVGGDCIVVSAN